MGGQGRQDDLSLLLRFDPAEIAMLAARDVDKFKKLSEFSSKLEHYIQLLNAADGGKAEDEKIGSKDKKTIGMEQSPPSKTQQQKGTSPSKPKEQVENGMQEADEAAARKKSFDERVQKKYTQHLKYQQLQAQEKHDQDLVKAKKDAASHKAFKQRVQKKYTQHLKHQQQEIQGQTHLEQQQPQQQHPEHPDDQTREQNQPSTRQGHNNKTQEYYQRISDHGINHMKQQTRHNQTQRQRHTSQKRAQQQHHHQKPPRHDNLNGSSQHHQKPPRHDNLNGSSTCLDNQLSPKQQRGYLRRPVQHSLYLPQQQNNFKEQTQTNNVIDGRDSPPSTDVEDEGKENQQRETPDKKSWLRQRAQQHLMQQRSPPRSESRRRDRDEPKTMTEILISELDKDQDKDKHKHGSSSPYPWDENIEKQLMFESDFSKEDGVSTPPITAADSDSLTSRSSIAEEEEARMERRRTLARSKDGPSHLPPSHLIIPRTVETISQTQLTTSKESKEKDKTRRRRQPPPPIDVDSPLMEQKKDHSEPEPGKTTSKSTALFEPDPKHSTTSFNSGYAGPASPKGYTAPMLSTLPEPPKGYNGTLSKSKLFRSEGFTLEQLNHRAPRVGLCLSFSNTVIAKRGHEVSHLIFEQEVIDLPYDKHQPFQWWVQNGQPRLTKVAPLDPAKYTQHSIPIFWTRYCYLVENQQIRQEKTRVAMYHYVGHYRCIGFERKTSAFKGRMSNAYLEFAFARFDQSMARALETDDED